MILAHRAFSRYGRWWLAIAREVVVGGLRAVEVEVLPYARNHAAQIAAQECRDWQERIAAEADAESRKLKAEWDELNARLQDSLEGLKRAVAGFVGRRCVSILGFDPETEAEERRQLTRIGTRNDTQGVRIYA